MKDNCKIGLTGVVSGFANGLFGAGGGLVAVAALLKLCKLECHEANATALCVMLPITVLSAAVYTFSGDVPVESLYAALGALPAGFIGARLMMRLSALWLSRVLSLVMLLAALRMLSVY